MNRLGTKADTLKLLYGKLKYASVLPQYTFTAGEWKSAIEKSEIPDYSYGTRREDQTDVINKSGLFGEVVYVEGTVVHEILAEDFIEGWKSHGTVQRQSKDKFQSVNHKIREVVEAKGEEYVKVPYTTGIWTVRCIKK